MSYKCKGCGSEICNICTEDRRPQKRYSDDELKTIHDPTCPGRGRDVSALDKEGAT
jgi:hypothetical protein